MRGAPALIAVVAIALAVSGCSPAPEPPPKPDVITFAHVDNDLELDPAAQWFLDRVAELSHGELEVAFVNECCGRTPDAQQNLVAGLARGSWELGWVATRGLEDAGIPSLQALSAPGVITSYAAEEAVLANGDSLIDAVSLDGLEAISLEPGTLRRPIAAGGALLGVDSWAGVPFWSSSSSMSDASISALGAVSTQVGNDDRNSGLDDGTIRGAENSVAWQVATEHVPDPYITFNAPLWPRTSVLLANSAAFESLTDEQREWITQTAAETSTRTPDIAELETAAIDTYCEDGGKIALATDEQLATLDAAWAPIVDSLPDIDLVRGAVGDASDEVVFPDGCVVG